MMAVKGQPSISSSNPENSSSMLARFVQLLYGEWPGVETGLPSEDRSPPPDITRPEQCGLDR
jgi:hypothetical protein